MKYARSEPKSICGNCRHFMDDPEEFERALPGILILSSGQGDTKGDQGLCEIHQRLLTPGITCRHFRPDSKERH